MTTITDQSRRMKRLTPHQADVLRRIERLAPHRPSGIPIEAIGSRGAVRHLADKGRVRIVEGQRGPRGGERLFVYLAEEQPAR